MQKVLLQRACGAQPCLSISSSSSHHTLHRGMAVRAAAVSPAEPETVTVDPSKPQKVSLVSLGCPKNLVDGEVLLGDLARAGFEITAEHEDADAILVNTCAFVEDAKAESLEVRGLGGPHQLHVGPVEYGATSVCITTVHSYLPTAATCVIQGHGSRRMYTVVQAQQSHLQC
eukprot:GHRQ01031239.1.p1 GENE.GHRQ01031239.1~~GHRQ01031239.1.p1  ORF type:complete len:172 (+),score=30.70 GHRQ01031239.1:164-679(+)